MDPDGAEAEDSTPVGDDDDDDDDMVDSDGPEAVDCLPVCVCW